MYYGKMRTLETNICIGLGDIICMKGQIEPFKNQFDKIYITYDQRTINEFRHNDQKYGKFLDDIGKLFFSEPPFILNERQFPCKGQLLVCKEYRLPVTKPNLKHILCKGYLLNTNEEYVVITTKMRSFPRRQWNKIKQGLWNLMHRLSHKYKIVILGEKVVENSKEYRSHGTDNVYSIYDELVRNLPHDRIIDLTVPALGIRAPSLEKIQQDCLIMSEAKLVVLLGIGGAFCMATAVANVVGYRLDDDGLGNELYNNKIYNDAYITKDWDQFVHRMESYL